MNTALYRLLDRDARRWWYHQELRATGHPREARARERQSIRDWVQRLRDTLANQGYLHIGPHGTTLYHAAHARTSCSWADEEMRALAVACRIPVLDTRPIPEHRRWETLRLPMIALGTPDPPPWTSSSLAPRTHVFPRYQALGAVLC